MTDFLYHCRKNIMTIFIKNILIDDRQLIYIIIFHIFLILNPIIDIFKINDIIN